MIRAIAQIDEIIKIIKKSKDANSAKATLMSEKYAYSAEQSESIINLTLRRLTSMEESKLKTEHEELSQQIAILTSLMNDDSEVYKVMKHETIVLKTQHGVPRRTVLLDEQAELNDKDLLANDRSVIIVTGSGYIKRLPIAEFEAQSSGGKGKAGARLSGGEDSVAQCFTCNDHDTLIFITDNGIAYSKKAFQIPLGARTAKGIPLPQVLPIGQKEQITSIIPVDSFELPDEHLVLLTKQGYVKKTPLNAFQSISARGLTIISLGDGDSLKWARRCNPEEEVLIATKDGFASRFTAAELSSTGRTSRGVRSLNLRDGDSMADMDILRPGAKKLSGAVDASAQQEVASYVLAVTEKGYGKRILIDEFKTQKRGGKGVTIIKFKTKAGGGNKALQESGLQGDGDALSCMRICSPGDEVVISTSKGTVMRQRIDDISIQSRSATGVLLQSIAKDDAIVTVDIVPPSTDSAQSSSSSVSSTDDDDDGNDLTPATVVYQNNLVSSGNLVLL